MALFALAIQLVLSFGHVHVERFDVANAAGDIATQPVHDKSDPSDSHHHGTPGHDFCAICAALTLTGNSVLPSASLLPLLYASQYFWETEFEAVDLSFFLRFGFQARAPPNSN
jgi:hypothetical protein